MAAVRGYARVSIDQQGAHGQHAELEAAGCTCIWTDVAGGALASRPQLDALLPYAEAGDTTVVARLGRLGRSLAQLGQRAHPPGRARRGIQGDP